MGDDTTRWAHSEKEVSHFVKTVKSITGLRTSPQLLNHGRRREEEGTGKRPGRLQGREVLPS